MSEANNNRPTDTTKTACENQWACNSSTIMWQRIHCKCLIEATYIERAASWIADDRFDDTVMRRPEIKL